MVEIFVMLLLLAVFAVLGFDMIVRIIAKIVTRTIQIWKSTKKELEEEGESV